MKPPKQWTHSETTVLHTKAHLGYVPTRTPKAQVYHSLIPIYCLWEFFTWDGPDQLSHLRLADGFGLLIHCFGIYFDQARPTKCARTSNKPCQLKHFNPVYPINQLMDIRTRFGN